MKEKVYKYSSLSFILINFWTLYLFFDYFLDRGGLFDGFVLLIHFFYSLLFSISISLLLLLFRLFFHIKKRKNPLRVNFLYILFGIFNLNLFLIWLVCISLKLVELDNAYLSSSTIIALLMGSFMIKDIYLLNSKKSLSEINKEDM
ncbi:hypothetical protein [Flavobacterium sp.]|jgi:hypothetical protein|uniref:hypothetical protein n=1 Tax=Flavobacterium sp. TaxID=239 RepID=UPI0037C114D0